MKTSFFDLRLLAPIFIILTIGLGYFIKQTDFGLIISQYFIFFALFTSVYLKISEQKTIFFFVGLSILLRFILVFSFPNLSDDIYRFVWDGHLINNGINPFNELPSYYMQVGNNVPGLTQSIFDELNSPNYFTIYPPICQGIFSIATYLTGSSLIGNTIVMKLFLFFFETGSIFLLLRILKSFQLPEKRVLLYALNPLPILEICGNLHFEGAMIFFLLLAIYLMQQDKWKLSAVAFSGAVLSKLLPLMFLPFLFKKLGFKKSLQYYLIVGGIIIISFLPFLNSQLIGNFGNSLDLYFQKFEFNASIYYVLRWIGFQIKGFNMIQVIGPLTALIVLISIITKSLIEKDISIQRIVTNMMLAICLYLFTATIVHPWYVCLPLVLCLFTNFRFPVLWSALAMLTYVNYSYPTYQENLWMVGLEYGLVYVVLFHEYSSSSTKIRT